MQCASMTIGTTASRIPVSGNLTSGVRVLARAGNSGNVYVGVTSTVTTSTGVLLSKGAPETSQQFTIPSSHFSNGNVYLIADGSGQVVDWSAD